MTVSCGVVSGTGSIGVGVFSVKVSGGVGSGTGSTGVGILSGTV